MVDDDHLIDSCCRQITVILKKCKLIVLTLFLVISFVKAEIIPADGLWGTTDNPEIGSGLMIKTQGELTVVSVFTYDDQGQNVWYIASGQVIDGVFEADLLEAQNGSDLMASNPQSAVYKDETSIIKLIFTGSQIGSVSIDGSQPKAIQTSHFGFWEWPTEQLLLADGTPYQFPDLSGDWVMADARTGDSYILSLTNRGTGASPPSPNFSLLFSSDHPATDTWSVLCPQRVQSSMQSYCRARRDNTGEFPYLKIDLKDMGNKQYVMYEESGDVIQKFQAFRLSNDRRLLPNDGYWRLSDDPGIGSGLVIRTQGGYTVILVYTFGENGKAMWGIVSGQFDEQGILKAGLHVPQGGSSITSIASESAVFRDDVSLLEVELLGTELGRISINGSGSKVIQNFNFGTELYSTRVFQPDNKPFSFPSQNGIWLIVDDERSVSSVWKIFRENPNVCQSPPDPLYVNSYGYSNSFSCTQSPDPVFGNPGNFLLFNCLKKTVNYPYYDYSFIDYCYGRGSRDIDGFFMKMYFEDVGFNEFRYYEGSVGFNGFKETLESIGRGSKMYQLFRLNTE